MAAALLSALEERKRASLEEVNVLHDRMLNLIELDKKLEMQMIKVVSDRANWDQFWQSQYDEMIEELEKDDLDEMDLEKESSPGEGKIDDMLVDESSAIKQCQSASPIVAETLNSINNEKKIRKRRIEYFELFLDVESKRNKILTQQAALSAQIKDLLEYELSSEEVLDPDQEPKRRAMIAAMARWWDCLLYNISDELNDYMHVEEIGKWSELYLKWRMWIDMKAGVFPEDEDEIRANYMAS